MNKGSVRRAVPVLTLGMSLGLLLLSGQVVFAREDTAGISEAKTNQGYEYRSGGVGADERNQMMRQANQYDLALSFAARSGDYLSDVNIVITDEHGKEVLNTTTAGPLFYAELPPGRYDVKATYNNKTEELKGLQIDKGRRVARVFHWNVTDDQPLLAHR